MPQNEQTLLKIYNKISNDFEMGNFEDFSIKMRNPESSKKIYDYMSQKYNMGSFDNFFFNTIDVMAESDRIAEREMLQINRMTPEDEDYNEQTEKLKYEHPDMIDKLNKMRDNGETLDLMSRVIEQAKPTVAEPATTTVAPRISEKKPEGIPTDIEQSRAMLDADLELLTLKYNIKDTDLLKRVLYGWNQGIITDDSVKNINPDVLADFKQLQEKYSTAVAPKVSEEKLTFGEIVEPILRPLTNIPTKIVDAIIPANPSDEVLNEAFKVKGIPTILSLLPTSAKRKVYNIARGLSVGIGETGEGLTSPLNIGLIVSGGALGKFSVTAGRVIAGLFSAHMATAVPQEVKEFKDAIESGDESEISRTGVRMLASLFFVFGAGKHAVKGRKVKPIDIEKQVEKEVIKPEEIKPEVKKEIPIEKPIEYVILGDRRFEKSHRGWFEIDTKRTKGTEQPDFLLTGKPIKDISLIAKLEKQLKKPAEVPVEKIKVKPIREKLPEAELKIPGTKKPYPTTAMFEGKDVKTGEVIKANEPVWFYPELGGMVKEATHRKLFQKIQEPGKIFEKEEFKIKEKPKGQKEIFEKVEPKKYVGKTFLKEMRAEIEQGEGPQKIISGGLQEGVERVVTWQGSTFPEYFKDRGYTKKETLNIIGKAINEKSLTQKQESILDELIKDRRDDLIRKVEFAEMGGIREEKMIRGEGEVKQVSVDILTKLIKGAKPLRKETEVLRTEEFGKRVGKGRGIAEVGIERGEKLGVFKMATAGLRGELPKIEFEPPLRKLSEREALKIRDDLFDILVEKIPEENFLKRVNTEKAVLRILGGEVPRPFEFELLESVYGKPFVRALLKKRYWTKKMWEGLVEAVGLTKSFVASGELSASLRQGYLMATSHPVKWGKAFGAQWKALFSEKFADSVEKSIESSPNFDLYKKSGLDVTVRKGLGGELSKREDVYRTKLGSNIPIIKQSERAFVTFSNKLRTDLFDMIVSQEGWTWKHNKVNIERLGKALNEFTGRGSLGALKKADSILNFILWSPRLLASRIQVTAKAITGLPKIFNDRVSREYARAVVTAFGTSTAILAMLDYFDIAEVEIDPRSSDWGKGRIGNFRYDLFGGFQQLFRYIYSTINPTMKGKESGRIIKIKRDEVISRFFRSKMSPLVGTGMDIVTGETFLGEEIKVIPKELSVEEITENIVFRNFIPLFWVDVADAIDEMGLKGGGLASPGFFGVGVQTHRITDGQKIFLYKDSIAWQDYGMGWDDLSKMKQRLIKNKHPEIEQMELEVRTGEKKVPMLESSIREQQKVGKEIQKSLYPEIKSELDKLNFNIGGLSRTFGDWYLNDERYKAYQEFTTERLNEMLSDLFKSNAWLKSADDIKRRLLEKFIGNAKKMARKKVEIESLK